MSRVTIAGVSMPIEAARNVGETGADVAADLAALSSGESSGQSLLDHCLDGADADRAEGWRQYVDALLDHIVEIDR